MENNKTDNIGDLLGKNLYYTYTTLGSLSDATNEHCELEISYNHWNKKANTKHKEAFLIKQEDKVLFELTREEIEELIEEIQTAIKIIDTKISK